MCAHNRRAAQTETISKITLAIVFKHVVSFFQERLYDSVDLTILLCFSFILAKQIKAVGIPH